MTVKALKIILQIMRKKKKKKNLIPSAVSSIFATKINKGQTTGARMECCDGMFLNMFIKMKLLNRQETWFRTCSSLGEVWGIIRGLGSRS